MRVLSGLGYGVLRPVLRDTTAIGSLMRRKLKPVMDPILARIETLRSALELSAGGAVEHLHGELVVALAAVVVGYVLLNIVPVSQVYEPVEWSVIVLLGAMIPIGVALETSGGSALFADALRAWTAGLPAVAVLRRAGSGAGGGGAGSGGLRTRGRGGGGGRGPGIGRPLAAGGQQGGEGEQGKQSFHADFQFNQGGRGPAV